MADAVLLDTCALIWLAEGAQMSKEALGVIDASAQARKLYINPMSAWEVGMLEAKNRISLSMSVDKWFENVLRNPLLALASLNVSVLIESTRLPGEPPKDPVDRIMIAMARLNGQTLITRDSQILSYAREGRVKALEC